MGLLLPELQAKSSTSEFGQGKRAAINGREEQTRRGAKTTNKGSTFGRRQGPDTTKCPHALAHSALCYLPHLPTYLPRSFVYVPTIRPRCAPSRRTDGPPSVGSPVSSVGGVYTACARAGSHFKRSPSARGPPSHFGNVVEGWVLTNVGLLCR